MKTSDAKKYGIVTGAMMIVESAVDQCRTVEGWLEQVADGPRDELVTQAIRMAKVEAEKARNVLEAAYQDCYRARTAMERQAEEEANTPRALVIKIPEEKREEIEAQIAAAYKRRT